MLSLNKKSDAVNSCLYAALLRLMRMPAFVAKAMSISKLNFFHLPLTSASDLALLYPAYNTALDSLVQALHQGLIVSMGGHVGENASSDAKAEEIQVSD